MSSPFNESFRFMFQHWDELIEALVQGAQQGFNKALEAEAPNE